VNKKSLIEKIAELVNEKKIEGISDIRDESDKSGMRVVIELKRGEVGEVILNNLYKQTQLQDTFGMNMVALVDGQPRLLNLKQLLECFLSHRREVVTRRTVFELRKARERGHILEGLAVALSNVDEIIALIKAAPTPPDAKRSLMERQWRSPVVEEMLCAPLPDASRPDGLAPEFGLSAQGYRLSDAQAQAILELRLQRLTGLEQDKIVSEYKDVMAKILDLLDILAKPERITAIIVGRTDGDPRAVRRRAPLGNRAAYAGTRHRGFHHAAGHGRHAVARRLRQGPAARRLPRPAPWWPWQAGGGDQGRGFRRSPVRCQYPRLHPVLLESRPLLLAQGLRSAAGQPHQRGKPIVNLFPLEEGERINAVLPVKEFVDDKFIFMATRDGTVKKTPLSDFSNPRKAGIIAVDLLDDDYLIGVELTTGQSDIVLVSNAGKAVWFDEEDVRPMGRGARGVRGMKLQPGQTVISLLVAESDQQTVLVATENGFGKRTVLADFRHSGRGTQGVKAIADSERNGVVVGAKLVERRRRSDADHHRWRADPHPRCGNSRHGPGDAGRDADRAR
jgi:DNA gyrase subunit A